MELDLRQLLQIARRRWWIVALLMVIAGGAAYISSSRETPQYSASATLLVNPGQGTTANDFTALQASRSLAETYRLLIETGPVLDRVIEELALDIDAVELGEMVSTAVVGETQLVEVTVESTDPDEAAMIANTIVTEFSEYIKEQASSRAEDTSSGFDEQIGILEERLTAIDSRVAELNVPENADDAAIQQQITDLVQERSTVNEQLTELNISLITFNGETLAASAQVEMADPARVPSTPFAPRVAFSTLLGTFVGLLIGVGLVALREYLDNTVKPEVNIQALAGAPVLATIASAQKITPGAGQVYTMTQPRSGAAESLRLLRTNLDFAAASKPIHSITITSPSPGEGKSTIVANLGVVMAQSGLTVAIIDADLRKPTQNRIFGVENSIGLTTLLTHPDESWQTVAQKIALPGLFLIPSGPIPPNPSDLLSSDRFEYLLDRIKGDVDLVIIDSPPILSASDSLAIATHTDGVVFVCQSHKTRTDALRHAAHSVHQGGIRLIGVVLNRQKGQQGASYYGEYYGSAPASSSASAD